MTKKEAERKGWRPLAGFFEEGAADDAVIFAAIKNHLNATGARCLKVDEGYGLYGLWRHGEEMETIKQTQIRIQKLKIR